MKKILSAFTPILFALSQACHSPLPEGLHIEVDSFDEVVVSALANSVRATIGELPAMSIDEVADVFASGLLADVPGFDLPEFSEIYSYISTEGAVVTSEQHGNREYYRFFTPSGAELFVLQLLNE